MGFLKHPHEWEGAGMGLEIDILSLVLFWLKNFQNSENVKIN